MTTRVARHQVREEIQRRILTGESKPGERLSQQRLAGSSRTDQQNIRFLQLDVGLLPRHFDALVVVVHGNGQLLLRFVLADYILIEKAFDLRRLGEVYVFGRWFVVRILVNNVLADSDTFVADEDGRPRDQFTNVILTLVTE